MNKKIRESHIEKKFISEIKKLNCMTRKYSSANNRGVPDRIVFLGNGIIHFVELKTDKGKLTELQLLEIKKLRCHGCDVFVIYGLGGLEDYIAVVKEKISC